MFLFFLFLLLLPQLSYSNSQTCFSSSCGKITNISNPFRLKQDPAHCGNNRYELDCVNNVTVLSLYDGYYFVESINYNNYTIRVVDPNIQTTNCSSLPRFFLSQSNFTYESKQTYLLKENNSYQYFLNRDYYEYPYVNNDIYAMSISMPVIYMKCTSPPSKVVDKYYVDTASCLDQHMTYAIVGNPPLEIVEPQCRVKFITLTSSFWNSRHSPLYYDDVVIENISYADIHKALQYGFEISWLQASCPCDDCFFNDTDEIQCTQFFCDFDSCDAQNFGCSKNTFSSEASLPDMSVSFNNHDESS